MKTTEAYTANPNTSRPKLLAEKLRAELERTKGEDTPEALRWAIQGNGEPRELDPQTVGRKAAERLERCGTFPRGRLVLRYPSGHRQDLGAHQCRSRFCPRCSRRRSARLGEELAEAVAEIKGWGFNWSRVRFATLTMPNTESAAAGIEALSAAWHRMLANRRFSRMVAGGFRCFEAKAGKDGKWNIHLHAIIWLWNEGVPYETLREVWDQAAGGSYNQDFQELKKKAKPRPGETREAAAVRYLTKYLVKFEEADEARQAPGGILHLAAALEGRRMFSAFGMGAVARRKTRHERPQWLKAYERHLMGYRFNGESPSSAQLESTLGKDEVGIPLPNLPGMLRVDDIPEQIEARPFQACTVAMVSPLRKHKGLHLLPRTKREMKDWLGWEIGRGWARDRILGNGSTRGKRAAWALWLSENPRPKAPEPFRWKAFWHSAPKEWTRDAHLILGDREPGTIGAAIWKRIQPDARVGDTDITDPRHWVQLMMHSVRTAQRTVSARCSTFTRLDERVEYLRTLPAHLNRGTVSKEDLWQQDLELGGLR